MTTQTSGTEKQSAEVTSGQTPSKPGAGSESTDSPETLDLSSGWELVHKGRDNKRLKAMRLLVTGRLRVLRVDAEFVAAECLGDRGVIYNLGRRDQRWHCSCPARVDCKHLLALQAVCPVNHR